MNKVKQGDLQQMGVLYERYHRDLFGYFYRLTYNKSKSEDMVQTVFYRLLKYCHTFEGRGKFMYWMYAVARNVWLDSIKKKEPLKKASELGEGFDLKEESRNAEERLVVSENVALLKKALQHISAEKREAIVLSKFQGLKYKEIATLSDCSVSAIKSRVQRGLEELKELMLSIGQ